MSVIDNIRNTIANFYLKLELQDFVKERKPNKFNFNKIETVGILFEASQAEDLELVKRYVNYLKEHKKKVKVIGYFDAKEIHSMTYSKLEYDFFSNKELNWLGKPSDPFVKNFMEEKLDLLIDLNIKDYFPLKYISHLSNAKFKVGRFSEKSKDVYDFMIQINDEQNVKYFLKQVDTYLLMMNKNQPA